MILKLLKDRGETGIYKDEIIGIDVQQEVFDLRHKGGYTIDTIMEFPNGEKGETRYVLRYQPRCLQELVDIHDKSSLIDLDAIVVFNKWEEPSWIKNFWTNITKALGLTFPKKD